MLDSKAVWSNTTTLPWQVLHSYRQFREVYLMDDKITVISQARMTSTRLPGKVLKEILGKPLLSYHIECLRASKRVGEVVIATTTNNEDDPIAALASKEGLRCYRGREDDVLDRYYHAAKECGAAHIMRVLADCPLIDPSVLDWMIETFFARGLDYIYTGSSFAEGTDAEMFTFEALEEAYREAQLKSEREHVSQYFRNNPNRFKIAIMENPTDDSRYRFTVDEPEDFDVVKAIIEGLYPNDGEIVRIQEIKTFLDEHPGIFQLNSHIVRNEGLEKSLKEDSIMEAGELD
jgi:spore coat polysaccharide biosynthesis protein SpsF